MFFPLQSPFQASWVFVSWETVDFVVFVPHRAVVNVVLPFPETHVVLCLGIVPHVPQVGLEVAYYKGNKIEPLSRDQSGEYVPAFYLCVLDSLVEFWAHGPQS